MNQVQESMLESSIDQHSNMACVEVYICIYPIYICVPLGKKNGISIYPSLVTEHT